MGEITNGQMDIPGLFSGYLATKNLSLKKKNLELSVFTNGLYLRTKQPCGCPTHRLRFHPFHPIQIENIEKNQVKKYNMLMKMNNHIIFYLQYSKVAWNIKLISAKNTIFILNIMRRILYVGTHSNNNIWAFKKVISLVKYRPNLSLAN